MNLRRHLRELHPEEYDKAILEHSWTYKLSTESRTHDAHHDHERKSHHSIPVAFLSHFVVADD
jgi:hypothetical protein